MQKLYEKVTLPNGQRTTVELHVLRSWQDISGAQIYLLMDGSYTYKNKAPIRSADEFSIISDPIQRSAAVTWWGRKGKAMSAKYYEELERQIEALQRVGLPVEASDEPVTELDAVLYRRRPVNDRRKAAFGDPETWSTFGFPKRPDWWGYATVVEIADMRYQLAEAEDCEEAIEAEAEDVSAIDLAEGAGATIASA
ncbi:MAG: hypothetical protein KKB20_17605, partial [Proteobacteria bacterium]|nr:hypothetical protein [Pseudomonadota bacterium]